jgi:hypothetical protein
VVSDVCNLLLLDGDDDDENDVVVVVVPNANAITWMVHIRFGAIASAMRDTVSNNNRSCIACCICELQTVQTITIVDGKACTCLANHPAGIIPSMVGNIEVLVFVVAGEGDDQDNNACCTSFGNW